MLARSSKVITLHVKERLQRTAGYELQGPPAERNNEFKAAQPHPHEKPARRIRPTSWRPSSRSGCPEKCRRRTLTCPPWPASKITNLAGDIGLASKIHVTGKRRLPAGWVRGKSPDRAPERPKTRPCRSSPADRTVGHARVGLPSRLDQTIVSWLLSKNFWHYTAGKWARFEALRYTILCATAAAPQDAATSVGPPQRQDSTAGRRGAHTAPLRRNQVAAAT